MNALDRTRVRDLAARDQADRPRRRRSRRRWTGAHADTVSRVGRGGRLGASRRAGTARSGTAAGRRTRAPARPPARRGGSPGRRRRRTCPATSTTVRVPSDDTTRRRRHRRQPRRRAVARRPPIAASSVRRSSSIPPNATMRPALDDADAVAQGLDELELVRREQHGHARGGLVAQHAAHHVDRDGVQAGERLVEHQDLGVVHERRGELDALLVAERQLEDLVAAPLRDARAPRSSAPSTARGRRRRRARAAAPGRPAGR